MNLQTIRRPYHFYAFVWFAFFTVVAHMPLWFTGAIAGKHLLMALLLDSVCFWTALYFARTTEHLVAEEEEKFQPKEEPKGTSYTLERKLSDKLKKRIADHVRDNPNTTLEQVAEWISDAGIDVTADEIREVCGDALQSASDVHAEHAANTP